MSGTLADAAGAPDPWDRSLRASLMLFAVAAPWSIAIAQIAIVLTALIVVARRLVTRAGGPAVPVTLVLVGAFLAVQAISIPLGVHPGHSLSCYRGSWVLLFPFVFWPALREPRARRMALVGLVVSGALAGLYGIVQHAQGIDWLHGGRALERFPGGGFISVGNLSSHLTYSGVLLPILFVALGFGLDSRRAARWLAFGAAAAVGTAVLFSFARTTWIGVAVGLLVLGFGRGWRWGVGIAVPVAIAVGAGALLEPAIAERLRSLVDLTDSPRWRLWQTALRIVGDHPVLGGGLGCFPTLFPVYKVPGEYLSTIHPHHDLLNVMVETGIIGGIVWIGIWVAFLRETHTSAGVRGHWLVHAARAGIVALLVAGLGQCFSTDEEVAQVWFFVLTAALLEADVETSGSRAPIKRIEKWLKAHTLPLARALFARRGPSRTASGSSDRLLVVRPDDRLGNLLLMTPFLTRLRETYPDATIGMLVGSVYAPLLRAWPWVDTWIVQDKRAQIRAPWRFVSWLREIRRGSWDVAFEMSNHNTHSYYSCLLTLASGAPVRIGFDEPRNQQTLTTAVAAPSPTRHFSLAPLRLLGARGVDAAEAAVTCPLPSAEAPPIAAGEPYVVVHVGGRGGKALPVHVWRDLVTGALGALPHRLVIIAGPGELDRVPPLEGAAAGRVLVAPPLDVVSLGHLLEGARAYVGCDSGVMHLAAAVGTPTVAIFFRSNPYHYAPLGVAHTTVLLANPYGVTPSAWATSDGRVAPSRLVEVEADATDSAAGRPTTDARAIGAIVGALAATAADTTLAEKG